jgi:hypothetical protein
VSGETVDLGTGCDLTNRIFGTFGDNSIGAEFVLHAAYPAGATVTTSWSSITGTGPWSPTHTFVQCVDDQNRLLFRQFHDPGSGAGTATATLGAATPRLRWGLGTSVGGTGMTISWNGVNAHAAPCGPP